jgi:hypothetical protein
LASDILDCSFVNLFYVVLTTVVDHYYLYSSSVLYVTNEVIPGGRQDAQLTPPKTLSPARDTARGRADSGSDILPSVGGSADFLHVILLALL